MGMMFTQAARNTAPMVQIDVTSTRRSAERPIGSRQIAPATDRSNGHLLRRKRIAGAASTFRIADQDAIVDERKNVALKRCPASTWQASHILQLRHRFGSGVTYAWLRRPVIPKTCRRWTQIKIVTG